jgi:hypothetical protein
MRGAPGRPAPAARCNAKDTRGRRDNSRGEDGSVVGRVVLIRVDLYTS